MINLRDKTSQKFSIMIEILKVHADKYKNWYNKKNKKIETSEFLFKISTENKHLPITIEIFNTIFIKKIWEHNLFFTII